MESHFLFGFLVLSSIPFALCLHQFIGEDYSRHPCRRICHKGEQVKLCEYSFKIEWYSTLSRACFDCPVNSADCLRPGCIPATGQSRPIVTANRHFPGPSIEVCKGDRVRVAITNALQNGETTTLHFHGLRQKKSPFMDGTPMVSQCPIQPGTTFTLEFDADDAGTHFWHSQSGVQRADGLAGAFIVRDPEDPHDYLYDHDNHEPIILQDWYETETALTILAKHYYAGTGYLASRFILINGKHGAGGDQFSSATITKFQLLDSTRRHRFRVINNAFGECAMTLKLAGHYLVLIASDGQPIKAQPTRQLTIYPSERYDFVPVFTGALTSNDGVYLLEVTGEGKCKNRLGLAQIEYTLGINPTPYNDSSIETGIGAPIADEVRSNLRKLPKLNVPEILDSLTNDQSIFKRKPDEKIVIDMDFDVIKDDRFWPFETNSKGSSHNSPRMNKITFQMPPSPLMSQFNDVPPEMICGPSRRKCPASEFCECIYLHQVPLNSLVELIMVANERPIPGTLHPVHLHGYKFHVLAMETLHSNLSSDEVIEADKNCQILRKMNYTLVKDTITVPPGGYAIVRFIADSPGIWLLESQVDYQRVMGMAMGISVGFTNQIPPPPPKWPVCGNFGSLSSASRAHSLPNFFLQSVSFVISIAITKNYW